MHRELCYSRYRGVRVLQTCSACISAKFIVPKFPSFYMLAAAAAAGPTSERAFRCHSSLIQFDARCLLEHGRLARRDSDWAMGLWRADLARIPLKPMGVERVGKVFTNRRVTDTLECSQIGTVVVVRVGAVPALWKTTNQHRSRRGTCREPYPERISISRQESQCMILRPGDQLEFVVVRLTI